MRHKDREAMDKIVKIIEEYRMERSEIPSIGQIAEKVHMSRSTVYYYLRDMDNKGMIEYSARKMETPLTQKIRTSNTYTPIVGHVRCGEPTDEIEEIEDIYSLPDEVFGTGRKYILRAVGDSMVDVGIDEGDLASGILYGTKVQGKTFCSKSTLIDYLASEDTFRNPTCEGCKELVRTFKRRKSDDTYNEQRRERRKREREKKG